MWHLVETEGMGIVESLIIKILVFGELSYKIGLHDYI